MTTDMPRTKQRFGRKSQWRKHDRAYRTEQNKRARERREKRRVAAMFQWMTGRTGY